jgi:SPASM domain peptide maturase of grasp-with-spasm system
LVQVLDHTGLVSVSIILPFHDDIDSMDFFLGLIHDQARIHGFRIYAAPHKESRTFHPDARYTGIVHFSPQPLEGHQACGVVDPKQFTSNIRTFSESLTHNTCLNQKVSILENGDIKNCPSTPEVIGNIGAMALEEAVKTPDLQKRWRIHKDQIEDCKVCEFRRVCTDCRAFVKVPGDLYSKPAKCRYNPYTATWDEGSFAV